MRADATGTEMVEARKGYARLTLSVIASIALAIAVVPMLTAGLAWGIVAGAVALSIAAGIDAAFVLDRIVGGTPGATEPERVLEPAA